MSTIFPVQDVQVLNRATTGVVVRIADFTPGINTVYADSARAQAKLAPAGQASFKLAPGHYYAYVEAATDAALITSTDFKVEKDHAASLQVTEHFKSFASSNDDPAGGHLERHLDINN